jgi:hypothetical protein
MPHAEINVPGLILVGHGFQVTLIGRFWVTPEVEKVGKIATQLCQKCKQSHPGRVCDYDEKPECAETITVNEVTQPGNEP